MDYDENGLRQFLKEKLKGKPCDNYIVSMEVINATKEAFPEFVRDRLSGAAVYNNQPQYIAIRYNGLAVCYVRAKKKRSGKKRYGGVEFVYDDFDVTFAGGPNVHNISGAIMSAEVSEALRKKVERESFEKYLEVYKFVKEKGFVASASSLPTFLSEASKAIYKHNEDPEFKEIFER